MHNEFRVFLPSFLVLLSTIRIYWVLAYCLLSPSIANAWLPAGSSCSCQVLLWQENSRMPWRWGRWVVIQNNTVVNDTGNTNLIQFLCLVALSFCLLITAYGCLCRGWAWCCLVLARERQASWMPSLFPIFCRKSGFKWTFLGYEFFYLFILFYFFLCVGGDMLLKFCLSASHCSDADFKS